MVIHLVRREDAEKIIRNIERNGGDASELRAALRATLAAPRRKGADVSDRDDKLYIRAKIKEAPKETGPNLVCSICRRPAARLFAGACRKCFGDWALSARPQQE